MNTDNAWIEYTVMNYHYSDNGLFDNIVSLLLYLTLKNFFCNYY